MTDRDVVPIRRRQRSGQSLFQPFDWFRQDMDDLFSHYFARHNLPALTPGVAGADQGLARLDMRETEEAIEIYIDLPGVDQDKVEVTLSDGALTIKGEREDETEEHRRDYHHIERSYGMFSRRIPLPVEVYEDKVEATFKKGVLTVKLPKSKTAKAHERKIAIRAA